MARWLLKSVLVVAVLSALAGPPALAARASNQTSMQALAHGVLLELNRIRADHGLAPLTLNTDLSVAAQRHTSEMITDGYFAHESADGTAFWTRLASYTRGAKNGSWGVGENLLWSSPDVGPSEALKLWMESSDHRANILSRQWRQIGVAAVYADTAPGTYGDNPVTVITTDFGFRN